MNRAATLAVGLMAASAFAAYLLQRRRRALRLLALRMPPRAVVISLKRFPAARKAVLSRCADANLEVPQIFEAVDGRDLSRSELERRSVRTYAGWCIPNSKFRFFDRELKWGEVGCALSHVGVWRMCAEEQGPLIVLEDDVDFVPDFYDRLREALEEVAALVAGGHLDPPDALYLGRKAMRPEHDQLLPRARDGATGGVRLCVPGFSYKTTAYVLWPTGAAKLLASNYEQKLIPVDDFLALTYARHEAQVGEARPDLDELFADAPRLHMLATRPSLCRERRGISSTENSPLLSDDPQRQAKARPKGQQAAVSVASATSGTS